VATTEGRGLNCPDLGHRIEFEALSICARGQMAAYRKVIVSPDTVLIRSLAWSVPDGGTSGGGLDRNATPKPKWWVLKGCFNPQETPLSNPPVALDSLFSASGGSVSQSQRDVRDDAGKRRHGRELKH
jgi:hypothetical protein